MKSSLLKPVLSAVIPARRPTLLTGAPGVGKTDIVKFIAAVLGMALVISHPVVADPTDSKGLAWPAKDGKSATFIPIGQMVELLNAKEPTLWFLDDLGQATPAVQAAYMQWILAREVNGHKLPDCVTIIAATNRRQDRAGVTSILEPVKGRFATIVEVEPCINDWTQWAFANNMPHLLIAFLRLRPDLLLDFKPTADITNSPTPRNWASTGNLMNLAIPQEAQVEVYSGAVGKPATTELVSFIQVAKEMPSPDTVLMTPGTAEIPVKPSVMWALSGALVRLVTENNFNRFLQYAMRVHGAGRGEFATFMTKSAVDVNPALTKTPEFMQLISGPDAKALGLA